ncbi:hypothetical protein GCM10020370_49380 [Paenibacillus hodogayensis]
MMIREGDLVYLDALDRLGRDYDGIISEWKHITRELNADIVCLDNETLFDSRKFKTMGDLGKLLEDQFLSMLAYVAVIHIFRSKSILSSVPAYAHTEKSLHSEICAYSRASSKSMIQS